MKRFGKLAILFVAALFVFWACEKDSETTGNGNVKLFLTDAPLDTDGIEGVYITFTEIWYHSQGSEWVRFDGFEAPTTINLLDLTRGESELLGQFQLPAGSYSQIRFMLEAPQRDQGPVTSPGCYLEFEDGSTQPLFVPSGSQSGFKATGRFDVPVNGVMEVTADFDVRRSVVRAGNSGRYILKPTIRLVMNNQAGRIMGSVTNIPADSGIAVYAYESGTYQASEAQDPSEEETRFPGAVHSDTVCEQNNYQLHYLAAGNYDLVVVETQDGEFLRVLGIVETVEVIAGETTTMNIDLDSL